MRKLISTLLLFLIFAFWVDSITAQTARIGSSTDSLRIGQPFEISVVVDNIEDFSEVIFPDSTAFHTDLEFRYKNRFSTPAGADSVVYGFQFFSSEDILLENLNISLIAEDGEAIILPLPDFPLFFRSTLTDEELRPLKPLYEFAASIWPYILLALLLLTLAAIAFWYYKKYKSRPAAEEKPQPVPAAPPFTDPTTILAKDLAKLREIIDTIDIDTYYVEITYSLRGYLEVVNRFPALEQTTREVEQNLFAIRGANRMTDEVVSILREADMVKFAKFTPDRSMIRENIKKAEYLLDEFRKSDRMRIEAMRKEYNRIHFGAGDETKEDKA